MPCGYFDYLFEGKREEWFSYNWLKSPTRTIPRLGCFLQTTSKLSSKKAFMSLELAPGRSRHNRLICGLGAAAYRDVCIITIIYSTAAVIFIPYTAHLDCIYHAILFL